jgi:hypothetical protein
MMAWLGPLTAAAAALLVWMIVPGAPPVPLTTPVSRAIEQQPLPSAQIAVSNTQPQARQLPSAAQAQDAAKVSQAAAKAAGGKAPAAAAEPHRIATPPALVQAFSGAASGAAAPSPLPAAPSTAAPPPQPAAADSAAAATPPASLRRTAASPSGSEGASLLLNGRPSTMLILSPDGSSQWRILANGMVQHSTDRGSTWDMQSTGVTALLRTGAAPAPSICWLAGREGTIVLSIDGRSWRRISFPETADLVSINATDDKNATVDTADGRTFSTKDGGQTWTR